MNALPNMYDASEAVKVPLVNLFNVQEVRPIEAEAKARITEEAVSETPDFAAALVGAAIQAEQEAEEAITIEDEVSKLVSDFEAGLGAVINENATGVVIERTIRDGVNPSRKLSVSILINMIPVEDEDEDRSLDGFIAAE